MNKQTICNYDPFAGPELNSVIPLTDAQKEIWISSRVSKEASLAFNQSFLVHFKEPINLVILQNAIMNLIKKHDTLRARISPNGEFLEILKFFDIPVVILKNTGSLDWAQIIKKEMDNEFNLTSGPLFRSSIYVHEHNKQSIIISAHHIICDGWSLDTLLSDLSSIYTAILYVKELTTNKHQFSDYVTYLKNQSTQIKKS